MRLTTDNLLFYQLEYEWDILQQRQVKVKEFSLRGARMNQRLRWVHYSSESGSDTYWYIVLVPANGRCVIKISSATPKGLQPVVNELQRILCNEAWSTTIPPE